MIQKVYFHPDSSKVQRKMESFGEGIVEATPAGSA